MIWNNAKTICDIPRLDFAEAKRTKGIIGNPQIQCFWLNFDGGGRFSGNEVIE
ncbi:MAG: hypothetical protein ACLQDM_19550 [Bradyrhizobium sp.]